jgi:hypothetical protein
MPKRLEVMIGRNSFDGLLSRGGEFAQLFRIQDTIGFLVEPWGVALSQSLTLRVDLLKELTGVGLDQFRQLRD